ncbi:MAG: ABC transporter permease [Chloroflexi bacterium CFX1]|nr:ABC transporter permease [Chloroflexi bacterium CFX1]MCK6566612.1 ABC transporter permease [Anaerolineales bacterium]MCQ3952258.1 ABC transporter permease [Chloroflexota bacterium]MDL1918533.1 ABC transporter permease [Chloroflexi bacterium CFX5]NUQ58217.1 ABC transporter permease [Anaerolineales bacterium]
MTNSTLEIGSTAEKRRRISFGVALVVTGLAIYLLFAVNTQPGALTTFGLNLLGSRAVEVSDLVVPALPAIYLLAAVAVFSGAYQMARGVRSTGWLVGILAFTFVTAFLLWGARDKSFNLTGMLSSSLVRATPIALAALCGVISERAAVINIGVEGIMLIAAQVAVVTATVSGSLYVGLLCAILIGGLIAAFHAFIVIRFRVDQVVSGVAINIFGTGVTSYISSRFMQAAGDKLNNSGTFPIIAIPGLSKIPVLGPVLFENNLIVYLTILLVIVMHILLYYTPWGLRTRAVGEHPKAADTLGVNVYLMRYVNVIIGGMIAGIGGAYFTIGSVGRFDEIMTAGKGFIGLAAMIFGNWNPIGAYTSSLIFGFADSLQVKLQILRVPIPSEFLLMAPYIVTMIILTGVVGRAVPPAADGQHYEK